MSLVHDLPYQQTFWLLLGASLAVAYRRTDRGIESKSRLNFVQRPTIVMSKVPHLAALSEPGITGLLPCRVQVGTVRNNGSANHFYFTGGNRINLLE